MSDNDDENRLDRAKRIRRMREGGDRDDESESAGDTGGDTPNSAGDTGGDTPNSAGDTGGDPGGEEVADETVGTSGAEESTAGATADTEQPTDDVTAGLDTDEEVRAPLPDQGQLEEALEESDAGSEPEAVAPEEVTETDAGGESADEEETRVLEFTLDDEYYCLDIEYIEEIVKEETITRVPNTPNYVEGVVDLRGQITTIINPKVTIGKENTEASDLIVVFDSDTFEDQGHLGWVVDDVRQVVPITDEQVNDPPIDEEYINGVIDREDADQFVIWTTPDMAIEDVE